MTLTNEQRAARVVVCAAIQHRDGHIICGARHHNCLQSPLRLHPCNEYVQGFIDQFNLFLSREEAWDIAFEKGQIIRRCGGPAGGRLYSENLY